MPSSRVTHRIEVVSVSPVSSYGGTVYTQSILVEFQSGEQLTVFDSEVLISDTATGESVEVALAIGTFADALPTSDDRGVFQVEDGSEWTYDVVGELSILDGGDNGSDQMGMVDTGSIRFLVPNLSDLHSSSNEDAELVEERWRFSQSRADLYHVL